MTLTAREAFERGTETFNAHDIDGFAEVVANDVVFEAPGGLHGEGKPACVEFFRSWFDAFPDAHVEVHRAHIVDDVAVEEGTFTGTHNGMLKGPMGDVPPTGRTVKIAYIHVLRFRDGKHVSFNLLFDRFAMLEQLGLIPAPSPTHERPAPPTSEPKTAPSPNKLFETLTTYQHTAALKAAIELDLFTAIGEGQNTVSKLAKRIKGAERGVRILCDSLVVIGFLTKTGDRYGLTADSAVFLDRKSQAYLGSAKNFLASSLMMEGFTDLATVVRTGRPLSDHTFSGNEHPIWIEFARSMAPLMYVPARETAKLLDGKSGMKVLDIAAGHGLYGIAIAQHNPKAKIVALDFPAVLAVAEENAQRAGISDRFSLLPGNALEIDIGSGFDAVLIPNLLHSLGRAKSEILLKKTCHALAGKGRLVIVEFVPNEDRVSPRVPALFPLMSLANNVEGDTHTEPEHRAMLKNAGFSDCAVHPLLPTPFTAIVAAKS